MAREIGKGMAEIMSMTGVGIGSGYPTNGNLIEAEDFGAEPLLDADEFFGTRPMSSTCDDKKSLKSEYIINTSDLKSTNFLNSFTSPK